MSKTMQNLVVLTEPSDEDFRDRLKGENMILNRFCIDEDAAFELSAFELSRTGVNYFQLSPEEITDEISVEFEEKRKEKGKEYSFLRFFISRNLIFLNN